MRNVIARWKNNYLVDLHVVIILIFVAMFAYGTLRQEDAFVTIATFGFIAEVVHIMLHINFVNQTIFITGANRIAQIPIARIRKENLKYSVVFLGGFLILLFLVRAWFVGDILRWIGSGFGRILNGIMTAFLENASIRLEDTPPAVQKALLDLSGVGAAPGDRTTIVEIIQITIIGIGALFFIRIALRAIRSRTRKERNEETVGGFSSIQNIDDLGAAIEKESMIIRRFDRSNNSNIRRMYMKTIKRANRKNKKIDRHLTPTEIESHVGVTPGEAMDVLHEGYVRARYSKTGCSDDELQRIKKMLKGIKA